jgi:hypothetical protein
MAQSNENVLTQGMRGSIGKQVVYRNKAGKTVVSKSPKLRPGSIPTPDQAAVRDKFKIALIYAQAAMLDVAVKAAYKAVAKGGQSAFNVAFKDAYLAPVVSLLRTDAYAGQLQDPILVRVIDNFKVTTVKVSITAPNGVLVEQGFAAKEPNGVDWRYICQQVNADIAGTTIKVVASDLPGNETLLQQIL